MNQETRTLKEILKKATTILDSSSTIAAAAHPLTSTLGSSLNSLWVAVWMQSLKGSFLQTAAVWCAPTPETEDLRTFSLRWHPSAGEGMVGAVWKSGKSRTSDNIMLDMSLPRSLFTRRAGFTRGLWVPIRTRAKSLGVLEILGAPPSWPLKKQIAMLETLAKRLARFIERTGNRRRRSSPGSPRPRGRARRSTDA